MGTITGKVGTHMNDLLKPRVVCWLVAAVVLTGGLLMLGEADDAPGLGGLGLLLGLAMVLHACRLAGLVRPGSSATILLAVCGVIAAVMPSCSTPMAKSPGRVRSGLLRRWAFSCSFGRASAAITDNHAVRSGTSLTKRKSGKRYKPLARFFDAAPSLIHPNGCSWLGTFSLLL